MKDPTEYMDHHTQKIVINPGIGYQSSSLNDVFEIRNKIRDANLMQEVNNFVQTDY